VEDKELTERLWDSVPGIAANSSSMWLWQLNQGGRIKGELASVRKSHSIWLLLRDAVRMQYDCWL
jgi:hypothetical protein